MSDENEAVGRVVVFTRHRSLAEMVKLTLNHGAFVTRDASDVGAAMAIIQEWHPHLAVVDLDSGGDQLLREIAPDHPGGATRIPTLALTRHGDLPTKLASFDHGVDDIMTFPLSRAELRARVLVINHRHRLDQNASPKPVVKLGELEVDILDRHSRIGSSDLHLTSTEQSVLYLLASRASQVVTRDEILDIVWGADCAPDSNVVDRHIRSLRAKLHENWQHPHFIVTVPGQGYRFVPVVMEQSTRAYLN